MIANKTLGYILLLAGLAMIIWPLWQSYMIFTAKTSAPLVFTTPLQARPSGNALQEIERQVSQAVAKIIPVESVTKILNLIAWSIFTGIMFLGGGALASIGVKLIK